MIAFLTLLYCGLVWLIFIKLKLLPWNRGTQGGSVGVGLAGILALLIAMNLFQPYSTDVRLYNVVIEIVPRVTGRVIEVPVGVAVPVKKGEVLFRIDPRPFQYEVERLTAELAEAEGRLGIAKAEYERRKRALQASAVSQSDVDKSRSTYEAAVGTVGSLEARLKQAKLDLEESTVYAPADGIVTNSTLRPGFVASKVVSQAVMTFLSTERPILVATYPPNVLRHIKEGDVAEIALDRHPGRIFGAKVRNVLPISGEGQLDPSGDIPEWNDVEATSRFAVRFELDAASSDVELPGGVGGAAAIYTDKATAIRIVRAVVIRMYTWLNYL
jgi:multidrug resistance efflux pump